MKGGSGPEKKAVESRTYNKNEKKTKEMSKKIISIQMKKEIVKIESIKYTLIKESIIQDYKRPISTVFEKELCLSNE